MTSAKAVAGAECAAKADMTAALRDFELRLTIKVGGMLVVWVGVILAALRCFPAPHP